MQLPSIGTEDDLVNSGTALLLAHFKRIDVLINNAGIFPESRDSSFAIEHYSNFDHIGQAIETNSIGACRVIHAVIPTMLDASYGPIVNITSEMSFGLDSAQCFSNAGGVATCLLMRIRPALFVRDQPMR
jgi:NAD(P)-dependent dehydrogenase (short-subunit alcohol dehydrogenase family)